MNSGKNGALLGHSADDMAFDAEGLGVKKSGATPDMMSAMAAAESSSAEQKKLNRGMNRRSQMIDVGHRLPNPTPELDGTVLRDPSPNRM